MAKNSPRDIDVFDPPNDAGGPDYIVQFKIKNGPLLRAIRMRGYKTFVGFAKTHGIALVTLYKYLSLKLAPLKKSGEWSGTALKIARALRLPPESLFPEQHLTQALAKTSGEFGVTAEDLQCMIENRTSPDPETLLIEKQENKENAVAQLLTQRLTAREHRVLALRYGLDGKGARTLEEVAESLGFVTRERIRQIERKAFRKLLHKKSAIYQIAGIDPRDYSHRGPKRAPPPFHVPQWKRDIGDTAAREAKEKAAAETLRIKQEQEARERRWNATDEQHAELRSIPETRHYNDHWSQFLIDPWHEAAYETLRLVAAQQKTVFVDDILNCGIPPPNHAAEWIPVLRRAIDQGVIDPTTESKISEADPSRPYSYHVYSSRILNPER